MKVEKRFIKDESFRAFEDNDKRYLEGYAAKFNVRSKLIFENGKLFTEQLERGAFDNVLADENLDVILTFNHSRDKVMARTTSGTLQLHADDVGLRFKAELPYNVSYANDTFELVSRGDLSENSFAFFVTNDGQSWTRDDDGSPVRTISNIKRLSDVSVVTNAAYPDTELAARSFEESERENEVVITDEVIEEVNIEPQPNNYEVERLQMKIKILKL